MDQILPAKSICFLLSAVLLTFILANFVQAQTYEAFAEKRVAEIRAEVAAIERGAAKYAIRTKNVEDIALEGTEATYYRAGKNLKKIAAKMYGETYNATGEFYYENGELIFVHLVRNKYDTQIGTDPPPKIAITEEQRFYFTDGELIRLLVGKKELKSSDENYSRLKSEILSISSKLKTS